jgi:endonuclease/exonuclease/phosphatase family metal-dependent hydrolase
LDLIDGPLSAPLGVTRMKIASFNINNIKRRLPNLLEWLHEAAPDVVCLQELKAADEEFPVDAIRGAGFEASGAGRRPGMVSPFSGAARRRSSPAPTYPAIPPIGKAATSRRR